MRILFITATRIGDAVLSTGVLNHLIQTYPHARFTVACGPVAAPLFEHMPRLEKLIVLEKKKRSLHWVDLWKQCAPHWWSHVIDLRNAPLTYLLASFRHHHLGRDPKSLHRLQLFSNLLKLPEVAAPTLWSSEQQDERASQLIPEGAPVLAVGPTANWVGKTWRSENFLSLCQKLTASDGLLAGWRIALFGHSSERDMVQDLIENLKGPDTLDLIGDTHLGDVFACLKRCHFYIGNDSGLMHMAVAAGLPTLGLFGPTQEKLYAPWGEKCRTVRTDIAFEDLFGDNFDHQKTDSLLDSLSVEKVIQAVEAMIERP